MDLWGILIGRRLANREGKARKITALEGVPAMGLDSLGSSAYGPEAALTILIPLGAEGLHLIRPIMGAILVLLAVLYISYRQTIEAIRTTVGPTSWQRKISPSPYRSFAGRFLKHLTEIEAEHPGPPRSGGDA